MSDATRLQFIDTPILYWSWVQSGQSIYLQFDGHAIVNGLTKINSFKLNWDLICAGLLSQNGRSFD